MSDSVVEFLKQASYEKVDTSNKIINTSLETFIQSVNNRQDCILYGPPGTSKTYMIDRMSNSIGEERIGLFKIIQFHSNFSYEEFIEGIVPNIEKGGFKYESGVFLNFCLKAHEIYKANQDKICIFVIDEINRANVTSVFGEVLNLIEDKGKRSIETPRQHIPFTIPPNVILIGTMNTADKTLAKLDFAFRRRFRFLPVFPSVEILHTMLSEKGFDTELSLTIDEYAKAFSVINAKINKHPLLGKNLMLGHVLWTKKDEGKYKKEDIGKIFKEVIFPQIENYCGSNKDVLNSILGPKLRDKIIYGYDISDDEVIEFLTSTKNSQMVDA